MLPPQSAARVADVQSDRARSGNRLCPSDRKVEAVNGGSWPAADDVQVRAAIGGEADVKGCDIVAVFWGAFIERDPKGQQAS
jgi:hypothetical protein